MLPYFFYFFFFLCILLRSVRHPTQPQRHHTEAHFVCFPRIYPYLYLLLADDEGWLGEGSSTGKSKALRRRKKLFYILM